MASVLGTSRFDRAQPAAVALGMAMQRTNILRDIDEDVAGGRIYVARETIERHGGLEPGRRGALLRDQIARADALYERGFAGIGELRQGRRAIAAAGAMYRELLRELERGGYADRPGRAVVPRRRKLRVAADARVAGVTRTASVRLRSRRAAGGARSSTGAARARRPRRAPSSA